MTIPYISATSISNALSSRVTHAHSSPISSATIECETHTLSLGDYITVEMGYSTGHAVVFRGYVKQISQNIPENTYTIEMQDKMIRASDYFIAANSPENPYKYSNIKAEDLVKAVLAMSGLTNFNGTSSNFTFGITSPVEVNLVSAHDFASQISNIITYSIWYDSDNDEIMFRNRKPYPVLAGYPELSQPGVSVDSPVGSISPSTPYLSFTYTVSEKSLRNKIVVYGAGNITGTVSEESPYLPDGFYKTAVLGAANLLDTQEMVDNTAAYNLLLLNRLTYRLVLEIPGDQSILPRSCISVTIPELDQTDVVYYVFSVNHMITANGFITELELAR